MNAKLFLVIASVCGLVAVVGITGISHALSCDQEYKYDRWEFELVAVTIDGEQAEDWETDSEPDMALERRSPTSFTLILGEENEDDTKTVRFTPEEVSPDLRDESE